MINWQSILRHSYLSVRIVLLLSLMLVALTGFLTYTTAGANFLIRTVLQQVPQVTVSEINGSIFGELTLNGVEFEQSGNRLALAQLRLDLQPACLLRFEVCIDKLALQQLEVAIATGSASAQPPIQEDPSSSQALLQLPLPVSVKQFSLKELSLSLDGQPRVQVHSVAAGFRFYRELVVRQMTSEDLKLYLPESEPETVLTLQAQLEQLAELQYTPLTLPGLSVPVRATVNDLSFKDVQLFRGDVSQYQLTSVAAQLSITPQQLLLKALRLNTAGYSLTGTVQTSNNWQVDGDLKLTGAAGKLALTISGAPQQLNLKLNGQGELSDIAINGEVELQTSLTSAQLPLQLQAHFANLKLPENTLLHDTSLVLQGDLQQFYVRANSTLEQALLEPVSLDLDLSGNLSDIAINQIALLASEGRVQATGHVHLANNPKINLAMEANDIALSAFFPIPDTALSAQSQLQINVTGNQFDVDGQQLQLAVPWQGDIARLTGEYRYASDGHTELNNLAFQLGENHIDGQAILSADKQLQLSGKLNLIHLQSFHSDIAGSVVAEVQMQGPLQRPQLSLSGKGEQLRYLQYRLQSFTSEMALAWAPTSPFQLTLDAKQLKLSDELVLDLQLNSTGDAARHEIEFALDSDWLQVAANLEGRLSETQWQGAFLNSRVSRNTITFALENKTELLLDWQNQQYRLGAGCWLHKQDAAVCIRQLNWFENTAKLDIDGKALPLIHWLQGNHRLLRKLKSDSLLNFNFQAQLSNNQLTALDYEAHFTPEQWQLFDEEQLFFIQTLNLKAALKDQRIIAESTLLSDGLGTFRFNGQMPFAADFSQIGVDEASLTTRIEQFKLAPFGYLVPQVEQLEGIINADISAKLNNQYLAFTGDARLLEGRVLSRELGINVHDLSQTLIFDGQTVTSSGDFKMGSGAGSLQADVTWQEDWNVHMQLKGEALEYDDNLMVNLKVSPDIELSLSESMLKLSGKINVPQASVKIKTLPEGAQRPSADIVFADSPDKNATTGPKLVLDLALFVDPKKQKSVNLEAFGLTTSLTGNLQLNGGETLTANGEVSLLNGTYKAYGQNLIIRQGDLLFNGPLEYPSLSLEAIRDPQVTSDNVIAGLRVEGAARQPTVTVFSNPDMSQAQALSYLLSGKALGAKSNASQESVFANVLLSYGLNKSEGAVSKIGKSFGVEDLSLAMEGQGDSSKVAVSGTIAPNVKIAYGVGVFDAISEVSLRYQLLPQLYLEAVSGLSNAFDIFYEFNYDPKPEGEVKQNDD
ncbi:translocation/assembly module TamB domain-containing protein [Planctobacterium marinum]|uniref:translocation/assembly module TamB domain-containing protein n=1 Tax=Planctobacterium marinum TaxID=1631968 RepID=UPI001E289FB3|nr:translocation/assembly module TamB domain-containing protein [Planctobacterium marinum]MCC2607504.1 translocation/assembly module TamB domain-containing protein [Planctobacterium marinum]